jgi:pimeloyl-ACP methyl ester carboxylesterase
MELPLLRHEHVTVRGTRIHYVSAGEGHPVLLLHGFPQFWYCWRHVIPVLSQRYRVIAPDLKGYGESDKPRRRYDLPTLSEEWGEFMSALGIERFDLIGHDWGGIIAWKMALDYPDRIRRLVILNAPFRRWRPKLYVFFFWTPLIPELVFGRWNDAMVEEMLQLVSYDPKRSLAPAFNAEDVKIYQESFKQPGVHRASLAYYRSLWRNLPAAYADRNKKIEVPTLVLWGIADAALPVINTLGLENEVRDIRIHYVPLAGHFIQEEQPEIVNEQILSFLTAEDRPD